MRYIRRPTGSKKKYPITDAMIELRNGLARELGFVLRPCSMGAPERDGTTVRQCWEKEPLDFEHHGKMISGYHCVPWSNPDINGDVEYLWPDRAEIAGWAIDKGNPLPGEG